MRHCIENADLAPCERKTGGATGHFGLIRLIEPDPARIERDMPGLPNAFCAHHDVGPRFRQPSGIETPQVHFRTVSTGAASSNAFVQQNNPSRQQSLQEFVDKETHVQIQSYLNHLMRRHTEQAAMQTSHGTLLLARLPHSQDEQ